MDRLTVYLGSDHVIQQPCFGLRQSFLSISTSAEAAIRQACSSSAAGILNTYQLDLDALCVKTPEQQVLDGFETFDVEFSDDDRVSLCTETALRSLEFVNASFVSQ